MEALHKTVCNSLRMESTAKVNLPFTVSLDEEMHLRYPQECLTLWFVVHNIIYSSSVHTACLRALMRNWQSSSFSFWRSQRAVAAKLQASVKHRVLHNFSGLQSIMERETQMCNVFLKFYGLPAVDAEDVL